MNTSTNESKDARINAVTNRKCLERRENVLRHSNLQTQNMTVTFVNHDGELHQVTDHTLGHAHLGNTLMNDRKETSTIADECKHNETLVESVLQQY